MIRAIQLVAPWAKTFRAEAENVAADRVQTRCKARLSCRGSLCFEVRT
jgi:hypothetical protein